MSQGPQIVPFGNVQATFILTITLAPVATAAATAAEQTFTVNGLQVGDQISDVTYISGAFPNNLVDLVNARVPANNTLALAFSNGTAGALAYPSGTFYLEVNRPYPGLGMSTIQ